MTSTPATPQPETIKTALVRADQDPSVSAGIQNRLVRRNVANPVFVVEAAVKINPGRQLEITDDIRPCSNQNGVAVIFTGALILSQGESNVAIGTVS